MKPSNPVDKYAVSVNKCGLIVSYLLLSKNGKFSKFYFLRADRRSDEVIITRKAVNLGDKDGMQLLCILNISEKKTLAEILKQEICKIN